MRKIILITLLLTLNCDMIVDNDEVINGKWYNGLGVWTFTAIDKEAGIVCTPSKCGVYYYTTPSIITILNNVYKIEVSQNSIYLEGVKGIHILYRCKK